MQTTIQKWGNGLAVRIPLAFAAEAKLTEDSSVDISVEDGKLVIARKRRAYRLAELLDGMKKAGFAVLPTSEGRSASKTPTDMGFNLQLSKVHR